MLNDYSESIIQKFGNSYIVNGDEYRYNCPFCYNRRGKADNDAKLYVNVKSGKFHCFKCNAKGFLGFKKTKDQTYGNVYENIVDLFDNSVDNNETVDENVFYIPPNKIEEGTVAFDYCINRNISKEAIDYYDLRLGSNDTFGRIIIPNEVYGDRGIWTDTYSARSFIGQIPKYKNPTGVDKNKIVFNLHRIKEGADDIYGVEGAITAICAGKDAVAFYGCHPSNYQIREVAKKKPKNFYAVLDNDEAGRKPNLELAAKMSNLIDGNVFVVYLPEGKDASDLGEYEFKKYVNQNKILYQTSVYQSIFNYFI